MEGGERSWGEGLGSGDEEQAATEGRMCNLERQVEEGKIKTEN